MIRKSFKFFQNERKVFEIRQKRWYFSKGIQKHFDKTPVSRVPRQLDLQAFKILYCVFAGRGRYCGVIDQDRTNSGKLFASSRPMMSPVVFQIGLPGKTSVQAGLEPGLLC